MFRGRKITGATEKRKAKNTRFLVGEKKVVYQKKSFLAAPSFAAVREECIPELLHDFMFRLQRQTNKFLTPKTSHK